MRAASIAVKIRARRNVATLTGDADGLERCARDHDRLVMVLNGGTMFGSYSGADSVGQTLDRMLAAPDGSVPSWGQAGRFLINVNGMLSVVEYSSRNVGFMEHFSFFACQAGRPYISETGFRSDYFNTPTTGLTVKEAAERRLGQLQRERVTFVEAAYVGKVEKLLRLSFVASGIKTSQTGLPQPGTRVSFRKRIWLIVPNAKVNDEGRICIAMLSVGAAGRHRDAPLSSIRYAATWPWEVDLVDGAALNICSDPSKHLTLGMVEAERAIARSDFHR